MKAVITLEQLENLHACQDQVDKFRELFGESVEVTEELALKHAEDFDFNWVGRHLLTAPALAEYEKAVASALVEYGRVTALERTEYERATAPAWTEYEKAVAPALAEYWGVIASALVEYERVLAVTFARLYIQQEKKPE